MFAATAFDLKLTAACGHPQYGKVRYNTQSQLKAQKSDVETMICDECRSQLKSWMSTDYGTQLFAMDLPDLTGTEPMIKWAKDIRQRRLVRFGPLMLMLSKNMDSELAKVTWKALYIMMMITESKYWIANRELPFSDLNLAYEVSHLMKDPGSDRGSMMGSSPYGYFRHKTPEVLKRIALFDPMLLPNLDVMPTIYSGF